MRSTQFARYLSISAENHCLRLSSGHLGLLKRTDQSWPSDGTARTWRSGVNIVWIARVVGIAFACSVILFLVLDDHNSTLMRHRLHFTPIDLSRKMRVCFMVRRTFPPIVCRYFPLSRITCMDVRSRGSNKVNSLSIGGLSPVDPDWDAAIWGICTCMPRLPVR
jgi:hypothetical protein